MSALLEVQSVTKRFGGLAAVSSLNLTIQSGELVGLIGPNGAGKTTVFNLLTGVYAPSEGDIIFNGRRMNRCKPHEIAAAGIARTFQNIRLFQSLSVLDNVRVAAHLRSRTGLLASILRTPAVTRDDARLTTASRELLDALNLADEASTPAGDLPYGLQRRLEIARALATQPKLVLLDEPAAGMNPNEKQELMDLIFQIRERFHVTILLIEHDMKVVMGICERITVLDYGEVIAEGVPEAIRKDRKVIAAYLGEDTAEC